MIPHRLAVAFVVLALLATACGDDGGDDSAPADQPTTTLAPEPVTTDTAPTDTVPADTVPADTDTATTAAPTDTAPPTADPYDGYVSEIYDNPDVWICWPGADDTCSENQDLTLVAADGSLEIVPFTHVDDAPVDCFYVYPTISGDQTANSDFEPDPAQEIFTTRSQAARYGSVCRVFAPVYRQNTLASMTGRVSGLTWRHR